jgi:malate synthase
MTSPFMDAYSKLVNNVAIKRNSIGGMAAQVPIKMMKKLMQLL